EVAAVPASLPREVSVVRRAARSRRGSWLSSQYLKTTERIDVCVSLRLSTFPRRSGPNEWTVARTCAPRFPESDRNSTGWPAGSNVQARSVTRDWRLGFAGSPGAARRVRTALLCELMIGAPVLCSFRGDNSKVFVMI